MRQVFSFQYNSCYCSTVVTQWKVLLSEISIQLLLLFNLFIICIHNYIVYFNTTLVTVQQNNLQNSNNYKGISIQLLLLFNNNLSHSVSKDIYFNTTLVTVQRHGYVTRAFQGEFQYNSCYCSTQK